MLSAVTGLTTLGSRGVLRQAPAWQEAVGNPQVAYACPELVSQRQAPKSCNALEAERGVLPR